ncbi:MAG: glycoside hydrolase family 30 protein [Bacteroidales bacterium]
MRRLFIAVSMTCIATFVFSMLISLVACSKNTNPDDPNPDTLRVPYAQAWLTKGDKSVLFTRQEGLPITPPGNSSWPEVFIDTTYQFQEVEGYGAALTGSSAYLFHHSLDANLRQQILRELFDPQVGIGLSYLRLTMGASDFSLSDYTYNDLPAGQTDFNLEKFSLSRDLEDVVPVLQEIVQIYPEIKLMGTPWSPPAWMKTHGSLKGGKLRTDCYPVYAQYFVRYIQEMQKQGIRIDAVTPQNEPLYWTAGYPCMEMQPEEQKVFIRDHLGPALAAAGLPTQIIIYDHNWDHPEYATTVLLDPEAARFIAGSAFHAYAGDVSAMGTVQEAFPDKGLYFTEISGGEWAVNFSDNLLWYMKNILIGTARNWSKVALFWNLALDQNHGPRNNGCQDCRGVITISNGGLYIIRNEEYYALAHFSKFIRPGAHRVYSRPDQVLMNMDFVAFQNTDGTKVLVAANYNDSYKTFTVRQSQKTFSYSLAPKSVVTLVWK